MWHSWRRKQDINIVFYFFSFLYLITLQLDNFLYWKNRQTITESSIKTVSDVQFEGLFGSMSVYSRDSPVKYVETIVCLFFILWWKENLGNMKLWRCHQVQSQINLNAVMNFTLLRTGKLPSAAEEKFITFTSLWNTTETTTSSHTNCVNDPLF